MRNSLKRIALFIGVISGGGYGKDTSVASKERVGALLGRTFLIHPPSLKSCAPSPCEARGGRGLGRGARFIACRAPLKSPLPHPLPTPPSWGEGIDRGRGGGNPDAPRCWLSKVCCFQACEASSTVSTSHH